MQELRTDSLGEIEAAFHYSALVHTASQLRAWLSPGAILGLTGLVSKANECALLHLAKPLPCGWTVCQTASSDILEQGLWLV